VTEVVCSNCEKRVEKRANHVRRSQRLGRPIVCSRTCAGLIKRKETAAKHRAEGRQPRSKHKRLAINFNMEAIERIDELRGCASRVDFIRDALGLPKAAHELEADAHPDVWRPIANWPYEVTKDGQVRRKENKHICLVADHPSGYRRVKLWANGKTNGYPIHRLVYAAWVGPIAPGMQINHLNGIKSDNRIENLEMCTPQENVEHSVRTGLLPRGDRHHFVKRPETIPRGTNHHASKLTDELALQIYLEGAGVKNLNQLAAKYGMSWGAIYSLMNGKTWRHVTGHAPYAPKSKAVARDGGDAPHVHDNDNVSAAVGHEPIKTTGERRSS
jgi:hypothetical protein